jgi:hypothetical protein
MAKREMIKTKQEKAQMYPNLNPTLLLAATRFTGAFTSSERTTLVFEISLTN